MTLSLASLSAFDNWLSSLRHVCGSFDSRPPEHGTPFFGEVGSQVTCGLEVAEIRTNASLIARRRLNIGHDDDRYCFLIVQRRGQAGIHQQGRTLELLPGEMVLVDSARACEIMPRGMIEHASFHVPRAELASRLPQGEVPFGKLTPNSPSGQILQLMINRIVSGKLSANTSQAEGEAICEALIALLVPLSHGLGQGCMPEATFDLLYQGCCQLIEQQLQDPDLTPTSLAERLNVSLRQLYRLFEAHDDTVCRYIQRSRLQACAEELASPGQARLSITEIAYRWCFNDSAHFSRTFKRIYGHSPRDYRRLHLLH
ncbi:transcriptional regulator FeaR [Vreelandella neptunia]|uniref:Transcriptional regulator FeaR n=1 Tax=Vreelandella neptunia TaxID=115551 RepID=A0ABS9SCQ4_9GAMM|nr:transcriptional regulator FeaR [Halomonas neptunia]MCH4813708.1 transcriptional regulator FeaR [Halomonas neptunia]